MAKSPEQNPAEGSRAALDRTLQQSEKGTNHGEGNRPQSDAKGQLVHTKAGANNNGLSSAEPRVISGDESGDATWPLKQRDKQ